MGNWLLATGLIAGEPQRGSILFFLIARRRQNLSDVGLKTCEVDCVFFYIRAFWGACKCTWKYWSISTNSPAQQEIKVVHDKWMSLIACGSIQEDNIFLRVWLFYCVSNFVDSRMWVPRYRWCQSYFMRFFFCLGVFSSSEVLGKITSIPTE